MEKEAMYYNKKDNGAISCELCPHGCQIREGRFGVCGTRTVSNGELKVLNYGEVSSLAMDPIEKKPLYHYKPGSNILSVGGYGCNFKCEFCQNYHISMEKPRTRYIRPQELINIAEQAKAEGNIGIAFTYNEPSIWYEYIYDVAKLAGKSGLDIILVTNGFINMEPLKKLLPYIDAMNIDLKAYNAEFYKKVCRGNLEDVKKVIEAADRECHVEITTLLVNGHNDSVDEIEELSKWLATININMPLHLTRYHPSYKFDAPATPVSTVLNCVEISKAYLNYVYAGNISGVDLNTYCPECGEKIVSREGYRAKVLIDNNRCPKCSAELKSLVIT